MRRPFRVALRIVTIATIVTTLLSCASRPTPIAYRQIDLDARCAQREEDGFREDARLVVYANEVRALNWQSWVGQRGSCKFDLADFRQTQKRPSIELVAKNDSRCKLLVWQQPGRVTLAHAGCEARCTPGIYEEAWPVLFDPDSGRCAQTR